jgi:hypothetical protein
MPEVLAALDAFLQGAPPLRRAGRRRGWRNASGGVRLRGRHRASGQTDRAMRMSRPHVLPLRALMTLDPRGPKGK